MNKEYINITEKIQASYNNKGLLSGYDFTVFVLSTILFRKLGSVKLVDSEYIFDCSITENKEIDFFINVYKNTLNTVKKEDAKVNNATGISTSILKLEEKVFDNYYLQIAEMCLSTYIYNNISNTLFPIHDCLQPKELTQLMMYFLPENENTTVYNPFAGMCSLGMNLSDKTTYYAEEIDYRLLKLSELRLLIAGKNNFKIVTKDSIESLQESSVHKYDFIVSTPPFRSKNSEIIDASFSKLAEKGKLVFTVVESILYASDRLNKEFRRNLVLHNQIETIIKLPSRFFESTAISSCILVLRKENVKNAPIKLIDASKMVLDAEYKQNTLDLENVLQALKSKENTKFSKFITTEEIVKNDYNLSVNRYFVEEFNLTEKESSALEKLSNILTIVKNEKVSEEKGKLIKIGDLSKDQLDYTKTFEDLENTALKNDANLLHQDSLLLSSLHASLNPTVFTKTATNVYYLPTLIFACLVNTDKVNLEYLVLELDKEYVSKQLNSKIIGTVIQRISRKDLLELEIVLPSLEEQKIKVKLFKEIFFEAKKRELELQREFLGLKEDSFKEFASMKHTFRQYLNDLKSNVAGTRKFILKNNDKNISLDMTYSKNLNISFKEHLLSLESTIDSMAYTINDFDTLNQESKSEVINLKSIIEEVKNRTKNPEIFSFEKTFIDIELFQFAKNSKGYAINPDVLFNKEDFFSIFSNIISNAVNHGFTDTDKEYRIRISLIPDYQNKYWILNIENNGNPIPVDFTKEHLKIRGEKTTNSKGNGIGGNDIYQLLKKNNSSFNLKKSEDYNFKVNYEIMIPFKEADFTLQLD
ncbi:N-6 DNA methylase [Tenacibaculum piscium]|uniref:N-6 DNA methylase n=1 Tax=Tenacibaculum piscium TaxID=1458515 RepID=UPI001EFBF759|nr:N-6 DNA methylase [Tenacibaculum piscium]MCG8182759.1 N-6 DNA methylase [Tenacibaculum piscium]MCG8204151.1 N-6 DNA methylase [Tenacibaculum piscium]